MKTILKIAAVFAVTAGIISCHDDVTIPDPGFDMSETVIDTLRRDTGSVYRVSFNVKAPNGVEFIQILNGRTYDVIEELDEYSGRKNFRFTHDFDLSVCDPESDSTFIYNIKIRTKDSRGYNKSVRILHMRKSHPEIDGPSSTLNVFGRAFVYDGTISTGYYSIESIRATLNGEETLNVGASELNGANTYHVYQKLTRDFVKGERYVYSITVTDSNGETKTFSYNLVGATLKKPVAYTYSTKTAAPKAAVFHYNDKGQLESTYTTSGGYVTTFQYDDDGRLVIALRGNVGTFGVNEDTGVASYGSGFGSWYQYNDDGSIRRYCSFYFRATVDGVTHKMLDPFWNRNDLIPESCSVADLAGTDREGFIYNIRGYNDYTMNKYTEYNGKKYITDMTGSGSNHIGPFEYLEDFEEGKLVGASLVNTSSMGVQPFYGIALASFAQVLSYAPVLNPMYINDFPMMLNWEYIGPDFMQMFGCKYVISSLIRPTRYGDLTAVHTIGYTIRDDGLLKAYGTIGYGATSRQMYTYYYDDEPTDAWESCIVAGTEEAVPFLK